MAGALVFTVMDDMDWPELHLALVNRYRILGDLRQREVRIEDEPCDHSREDCY